MSSGNNLFRKSALLSAVFAAIMLWGCLNNEQQPETFDLPAQFADSLSGYDRVLIILKDTAGNPLDTLFQGRVSSESQLKDLSAPHFKGGKAIISIIGYKDGVVTYDVDRLYDGRSGSVEEIKPIVLPSTRVKIGIGEIRIASKTSAALPPVTIEPSTLLNKALRWSSSNPSILKIEGGRLLGIKAGTATLKTQLESDTSKSDVIQVEVYTNPTIPDSLKLNPDTLTLVAGGRPGQFAVAVFPSLVPASVTWRVMDSSIAGIDTTGQVTGIKAGTTAIIVRSTADLSIADSAALAILAPLPVQSVRFGIRSLTLFVGGASEALAVEVKPADANQEVEFLSRDAGLVSIQGGTATGKKEGVTWIKAFSKASPDKVDSIPVTVLSAQRVESVSIAADSITLYTGGVSQTLTATVLPANATSWISWKSADPSIAVVDTAGKVAPLKAGRTQITAVSKADSTRKDNIIVVVKKDTPRLSVGGDITVSVGATVHFAPTAPQEYGSISLFEWDLDGDGKWDGSASTLRDLDFKYEAAKEVAALFHVRDSEGNDTAVTRKIKAVSGPLIRILTPPDSAYFNASLIDVSWSVDGATQTTFTKETLKEGPNTLTRSAPDATGKIYSTSITVFLDTKAPGKPVVKGPGITNSVRPAWSWTTGGGGTGIYRYRLDNTDLSAAPVTPDTTFTPAADLPAPTHTLYVQERDLAGNWSELGTWTLKIDTQPPSSPVFDSLPLSPLNTLQPTWTWKSGGGGISLYRYALDDSTLLAGGTNMKTNSFLAPMVLTAGLHVLFVQEADSAGNWSRPSSKSLVLAKKETVGTPGFSPGRVNFTSLALNSAEVPYVAFDDAANSWKATVMRLNAAGTKWENVGNAGFSVEAAINISLVLNGNGVPHVAYSDRGNGLKATVKRLNAGGTAWESVGNPDVSAGVALNTSLALNSAGVPYVAYSDGALESKITVKRLIGGGTAWQTIGGSGFTPGATEYVSLVLSGAGVPYVAFKDMANGGKATVMRLNLAETGWETVGGAGLSLGEVHSPSLALSSTGVPYLAFQDEARGKKATVMRLNAAGTGWETAGNAGFTQAAAIHTSLALGPTGIPHVAFKDIANGDKTTVMRLNAAGTGWETVGSPGISVGEAVAISLDLNSAGVPYVAFSDLANDYKATVVKTSFDP